MALPGNRPLLNCCLQGESLFHPVGSAMPLASCRLPPKPPNCRPRCYFCGLGTRNALPPIRSEPPTTSLPTLASVDEKSPLHNRRRQTPPVFPQGFLAQRSQRKDLRIGRHEETRTPDLYRVNFEVTHLKPFPYLAFPHSRYCKEGPKTPSFDGELMAGFASVPQAFLQQPLDRGRARQTLVG